MFEGKLPQTEDAIPLVECHDGDELRMLSWADLVARLSASRELRASYGDVAASFDAGSARCIAAQHNGEHGVNLEDSSYRKAPHGMAKRAVQGADNGVARN